MENESLTRILAIVFDFIAPSWPSAIFNCFITIIWIVAVFWTRKHISRYKLLETNMLNKVKSSVDKWFESRGTSKDKKTSEHLINLENLKQGINKESLIFQRINIIANLRQHRVKINFPFLQEATNSNEQCRPGMIISQTVMNLSLMLGLLGTFVGLAIMVRGMNASVPNGNTTVLDATNLAHVLQDMQGVFSGIRTAFTASIFGICCSIHCLLKSNELRKYRDVFLTDLDSFTIYRLLPASIASSDDETLLESISNQIKDSFTMLDSVLQKNTSILEEINGISTAVGKIVEAVKSIIYKEDTIDHTEIISSLGQVNNNLAQVIEQLPVIAINVEASAKNVSNTTQSINSAIVAMRSQQQNFPVNSFFNSQMAISNQESNINDFKTIENIDSSKSIWRKLLSFIKF